MPIEPAPPRMIDIEASAGFSAWLAATGGSLAFTSYASGEVFVLGTADDGRLTACTCGLPRPMGLGADAAGFWVASNHQLWRFENFLPAGIRHQGHDAVLVPVTTLTTGEIDIHDIAPGDAPDPRPWFVATRMNCLARTTPGHSFEAVWTPPFIDSLTVGDRCHLNGLAMAAGQPFAVTAFAATSDREGWRKGPATNGLVVAVPPGRVLATGLSMPHSPRLHDGRLWLHDSGTGRFGWIDLSSGAFVPVAELPGFLRGLAFSGAFAVMGLSTPRSGGQFDGLALGDRLAMSREIPECGLAVVDTRDGRVVHRVRVGPGVKEIYDVALLPGMLNPRIVRPGDDDLRYLLRPHDGRKRLPVNLAKRASR